MGRPRSTPRSPEGDAKAAPKSPPPRSSTQSDPASTQTRAQSDARSIPKVARAPPEGGPRSTPRRPDNDPISTLNRPRSDAGSTQIRPPILTLDASLDHLPSTALTACAPGEPESTPSHRAIPILPPLWVCTPWSHSQESNVQGGPETLESSPTYASSPAQTPR